MMEDNFDATASTGKNNETENKKETSEPTGNDGKTNAIDRLIRNVFHGAHMDYVTAILIVPFIWTFLFILFGKEVLPPHGGLFCLLLLIISSLICGQIANSLGLPPLLGMLISGIVLANIGVYKAEGVYLSIVSRLRETALTMILLKGGLGLESDVLYKNSFTVIKLALLPCIAEGITVAAAAHYISNIPWIWTLCLGFVLSAVSPAVVVTSLLQLKKDGWGEDKGISTMIIAASNIDDVVCISIFGILIAMLFVGGDLVATVIRGPIELVIGVAGGLFLGYGMAVIPSDTERLTAIKRIVIISICNLSLVMGTPLLELPGAGPLAAIVSSFIANSYWKKHIYKAGANPVEKAISVAWAIMQPLLFGLVGADINLRYITIEMFLQGIAVLAIGLFGRMIVCYLAVLGSSMNFKEMMFVNLAWLPKATVQAALGPVLLDLLHEKRITDEKMVSYATYVLSIAVLSILITAPIGAIGISVMGPKLLNKPVKNNRIPSEYDNYGRDIEDCHL